MNLNEAINYLERNGYAVDHNDILDEGLKDWIKAIKEKAAGFTKKKLETALAKAISKDGIEALFKTLNKFKKVIPEKADSVDQLIEKIKKVIESSKKESNDNADENIDVNEPALASEAWAIKYDMPMLNETWDWEWDVNSEARKDRYKNADDHSSIFWVLAHLILGWAINFWEAFTGEEQFYGFGKRDWLERLVAFFAGMRDLGITVGVVMAGISILLVLSGVPAKELAGVYAERIGDAISFLQHII